MHGQCPQGHYSVLFIVSPKLIVYQMKKQKICRSHLHGMLRGIILFISTFSLFVAQAQSINVSGQVKDETGRPVEAVSVIIKGKTTGTQTDAEGKFSLAAEQGSTLVFSSVGFAIIELPASADMQVTLKISSGVGDEVVVVGYATQRKVNMTGAVGTISGKELESRPVTNVSSALSGLSPGVYVRQTSGRPGADGAQVLIRGLGTLSNQAPLILIDGIIGNMDAVNPMDIESISVLKDAASASIMAPLLPTGLF
jgi:outer membrane receptor protein involved in Fe transport